MLHLGPMPVIKALPDESYAIRPIPEEMASQHSLKFLTMPQAEGCTTGVGLLLTDLLCASAGGSDAVSRTQEPASTSYSATRTTERTSTSAAPVQAAQKQTKTASVQSSPPAFLQFPSHAATEREAAQVTTTGPANTRATEVSYSHRL